MMKPLFATHLRRLLHRREQKPFYDRSFRPIYYGPMQPQEIEQLKVQFQQLQAIGVQSYRDVLKVAGNPHQPDSLRLAALGVLYAWGGKRASHLWLRLFVDDQQRPLLAEWSYRLPYLLNKADTLALWPLMADHPDVEVQHEALYGVIFSDYVYSARLILMALLADSSRPPELRGLAAEGLAYARYYPALPLLTQLALAEEAIPLRFDVVFALGQIGHSETIPVLQTIAQSDSRIIPNFWDEEKQPVTIAQEALAAIEHIQERGRPWLRY